jgi:hypothetical protein
MPNFTPVWPGNELKAPSSIADLDPAYAPAISGVDALPHQVAALIVIIVTAITEGIPVRPVKPEAATAKSTSVKPPSSVKSPSSTMAAAAS